MDSTSFAWHHQAGLALAIRHLRRTSVPVFDEPMSELPRLSKRTTRFALRVSPKFLDRADLSFPVIIAGRGWYQIALDGRHRISKAIWTGVPSLHAVRVPWWYALDLLCPGFYEVEWLILFLRKEHRRAGHRRSPRRTVSGVLDRRGRSGRPSPTSGIRINFTLGSSGRQMGGFERPDLEITPFPSVCAGPIERKHPRSVGFAEGFQIRIMEGKGGSGRVHVFPRDPSVG